MNTARLSCMLFCAILVLAPGLVAQAPPQPAPPAPSPTPQPAPNDAPAIILPDAPTPPKPPPLPPNTPTALAADQLYVVRSNLALIVLAAPDGVLKVTTETGPLTVRGLFVGGTGKTETKRFPEKNVYLIEAQTAGRAELLIVPAGTTDSKSVVRVLIDANVGPVPPPVPPGPPPPGPEPTDEWWPALKTAYLADPGPKDKITFLAAAWRQAAAQIKTVNLMTAKEYLDVIHTTVQSQLGDNLMGTRKAVAVCLGKVLPSSASTVLDDTTRAQCSAAFLRVAVLLDALASVKGAN